MIDLKKCNINIVCQKKWLRNVNATYSFNVNLSPYKHSQLACVQLSSEPSILIINQNLQKPCIFFSPPIHEYTSEDNNYIT